jgi:hypothetical protein
MRIKFALGLCIVALGIVGSASAQTTQFNGTLDGTFTRAVGGNVSGVGTSTLQFNGSTTGTFTFTPAATYAAFDQPFLLGKIDFDAGGNSPSNITFTLSLDATFPDGRRGRVDFGPNLEVEQFAESSYRLQTAFFTGSDTTTVGRSEYTLHLDRVTPTTTYDPNAPRLITDDNGPGTSEGFVWAKITQRNLPYPPCHEPHPVPEPATWVMALLGMVGLGGMVWLKKRFVKLGV